MPPGGVDRSVRAREGQWDGDEVEAQHERAGAVLSAGEAPATREGVTRMSKRLRREAGVAAWRRRRGAPIPSALLLRAVSSYATKQWRRCSRPPTGVSGHATKEWRRCSRPAGSVQLCYKGTAAVLASTNNVATSSVKPCYEGVTVVLMSWRRRPVVLQRNGGGAPVDRRRCYQQLPAML